MNKSYLLIGIVFLFSFVSVYAGTVQPNGYYENFDNVVSGNWSGGTVSTTNVLNTTNAITTPANSLTNPSYPLYYNITPSVVNMTLNGSSITIQYYTRLQGPTGHESLGGLMFANSSTATRYELRSWLSATQDFYLTISNTGGTNYNVFATTSSSAWTDNIYYKVTLKIEKNPTNYTLTANASNLAGSINAGKQTTANFSEFWTMGFITPFFKDGHASSSPTYQFDEWTVTIVNGTAPSVATNLTFTNNTLLMYDYNETCLNWNTTALGTCPTPQGRLRMSFNTNVAGSCSMSKNNQSQYNSSEACFTTGTINHNCTMNNANILSYGVQSIYLACTQPLINNLTLGLSVNMTGGTGTVTSGSCIQNLGNAYFRPNSCSVFP